jgi:hypothetical protein
MKIYLGKPTNWFGPYQLAELLCFWAPKVKDEFGFKEKPEWVSDFGEFLAYGFHKKKPENDVFRSKRKELPKTLLYKFLEWVHSKKIEKKYIKIDYWDTWSIDHTLAPIILPMLKQLKETKHGSGFIDLEDVPEAMRLTTTEDYDDQKTFDFYNDPELTRQNIQCDVHDRYEWALDEMIFAFEHLVDDSWEDKYRSGEIDWVSEPCKFDADGKPTLYQFKDGPDHTYKCDYDGLFEEWKRVDNGLRLFGKYFRTLWD